MKYTKEFKEEAIKLSDEIGLKKATAELGLNYYTIADWRKDRKANEKKIAALDPNEQAKKLKELETQVFELTRANEILKDALGFFAKDRKK